MTMKTIVPLIAICLIRDGKRITLPSNVPATLTEDEITSIKSVNPQALRDAVSEVAAAPAPAPAKAAGETAKKPAKAAAAAAAAAAGADDDDL